MVCKEEVGEASKCSRLLGTSVARLMRCVCVCVCVYVCVHVRMNVYVYI
jgi:hypothetical protein